MALSRQEIFRRIRPGPRLRMAARLYAAGAVPTKKAACEAVGLSSNYLTVMNGNPEVNAILSEVDRAIGDQTVELSKVVALVSRKAAKRMNELIDSSNEHVALRASSDILDRNPETSKTFKATVTSFALTGEDARELAKSLVEAARVKEQFLPAAAGDVVRVSDEEPTSEKAEGKEPEVRQGNGKVSISDNREGVEVSRGRTDGEP